MSTNRPARQRARPLPSGGTRSRSPRRLPGGTTLFTPEASAARRATEHRSARPLLFLYQLPAWVPPIVLAILLIAGLAVRGPGGAVALCAVGAVLGWLAAVSWPRLATSGRAGRLLAVAVVFALAGFQATR